MRAQIKDSLREHREHVWPGKLTAKAAANLPQTASGDLFTITGGKVAIEFIIGEVTTVVENQANDAKLLFNPTGTGASTDLCTVLDLDSAAVGSYLYINSGTGALAKGVYMGAGMTARIILGPGAIQLNCAASNTGQAKWLVSWIPLETGATLVAA